MTADERVVLTLFGSGEGTYASQLAIGKELVASPRQDLMAIGLVTYVPHDAVLGCIEHVVQRHRQFYYSKT